MIPDEFKRPDVYCRLDQAAVEIIPGRISKEIFNPLNLTDKEILDAVNSIEPQILGGIRCHIKVYDQALGRERDSHLLGDNIFIYPELASMRFVETLVKKIEYRTYDVTPTRDPESQVHKLKIGYPLGVPETRNVFIIPIDTYWRWDINIDKVVQKIQSQQNIIAAVVSLFNVSGKPQINKIPIYSYVSHKIRVMHLSNPVTPIPETLISYPLYKWSEVQKYAI